MRMNQRIDPLSSAPQGAAREGILSRVTALLRGVARPQPRSLRCVETLQLGPKRALYLVECDGERFLAGAGSDGIHTLQRLTAKHAGNAAS